MNECFKTTLKGAVSDTSLLKLGECRLAMRSGRGVASYANGFDVTLNIIEGTAVFTYNNSQTISLAGTQRASTPSAFVGVLQILNKYGLTVWNDSGYYYIANLADFKYSNRLTFINGWVVGDLSDLPVGNSVITKITMDASQGITGDVKWLSGFSQILDQFTASGSIYGNVSTIGNKANNLYILTDGALGDLTGDVTTFGTYSNLNSLRILGGKLTGDISNIGAINNVVAMDGTFTWNGRTKDGNLPTLGFINGVQVQMKITNIDEAIADWATLTPSSTANNARIRVYGNRTSASDAAYATLQSRLTSLEIIPYTA